jgi:fibronectin type 3 domain-containing protein
MIYIPTGDVVNMISFNGPTSTTQAPGPVQNLAAIGGNAQVLISWQAPTSDGGSAVTGYRVYRSLTSGGEYEELAAPTALNYTDTGLMNGQAYYYKVSAVNAIGEGAKVGPATATPATTPSAPQSLSAVSSVGKVSLTWQAPSSNGGAAITRYDIYRGLTPETIGTTPVANVNGGVLLYDDATVSASTTYYYKVKAVNSVGPGPASNIANATTPAPTAPGAPQNPTASPGPSKVTITWQAPASDGGSPITGYKVFSMVNDTPVLLTTVGAGTLSYVHSNPPDVMNVYYITAANAVGEGAHSTTVTAQPQAATTDNSMLYLGVVAAVVVVGVIVAYLVMRKKK